MGRYRTINTDLNRQYRNDLNANFAQIEADILGQQNFTEEMKNSLLNELSRIERESKERDDFLAGESLEVLLQSIADAKNSANTAASNANTKATHAQTQGDYAKGQGDFAKNQGDYAKTKGDYANEKANVADQAAAKANTEANNLSQLKVDTLTATQNANAATSNANNSAAHAQQQGDYAKLQADRAKDVVDGTGLLTQTDIGVKVAGFNANGQVLDKNGNVVEGKVKSVNNVGPDENGNITVPTFSGDYNDLINKPTIPDTSNLATKTELAKHFEETTPHKSLIVTAEGSTLTSTTSTSYVDMPEMTVTLNIAKNNILAFFSAEVRVGTASTGVSIALSIDGGVEVSIRYPVVANPGQNNIIAFQHLFKELAPGSHTIKVRWKVSANNGFAVNRSLIALEVNS